MEYWHTKWLRLVRSYRPQLWPGFLTIIPLLELIVVVASAWLILYQIHLQRTEMQKSTLAVSEQLTITLNDDLSNPTNTAIFTAADKDSPILIPKGHFTPGQIDNLLGEYEALDNAYKAELISKDDLCSMFSDGLSTIDDSNEIQQYIANQRMAYSLYYTGYLDIDRVSNAECQ